MVKAKIKDEKLAPDGKKKIEWAARNMPVLYEIKRKFVGEPLKNIRISACLHVTSETANLMLTLKEAGAELRLCASNPLSTKDDVAASLVKDFAIPVFAMHGEDRESYYDNIKRAVEIEPHITMDDGGDLTTFLHENRIVNENLGGTEETTTGVIRFRAMERDGTLLFPIIAVNDSRTKYLFDNRYGTGQSTLDGILRATNLLIAGSKFVVCGYGWCGRGIASRAKGLGARVIVTEVDPIKALEAVMDGFEVIPIEEAAKVGNFFVTATGDKNVIGEASIKQLKDGAILSNAGHFDVEIDKETLEKLSSKKEPIRPGVECYYLKDGRKLFLLAEGRLVNLGAAEGHPPTVMDMSFANQALAAEYLVKNGKTLSPKVYTLPPEIDKEIAYLKLKSMGIAIDELTPEQERYLGSWQEGT